VGLVFKRVSIGLQRTVASSNKNRAKLGLPSYQTKYDYAQFLAGRIRRPVSRLSQTKKYHSNRF